MRTDPIPDQTSVPTVYCGACNWRAEHRLGGAEIVEIFDTLRNRLLVHVAETHPAPPETVQ